MPFALPAVLMDVDTWVGGGVGVVASVTGAETPGTEATLVTQPELDARFAWGPLYGRLDLDLQWDPRTNERLTPDPPEWAMLQIGRDRYFARVGVTNPNIGLEDWDAWNNYLPSYSVFFDGASPGRLLGLEPGMKLNDDTEVFVWGGYDLDFAEEVELGSFDAYEFGVGVASEHEAWSTWTGIAAYPGSKYYGLFGALELYPHEDLTVALDGGAGLSDGSLFTGAQLVLNAFPDEVIGPVARLEGVYDKDEALGGAEGGIPTVTASAGFHFVPDDYAKLLVEGKISRLGDEAVSGVWVSFSVTRPAPPAYEAVYEEDEEAESAAPEGPAPAPESAAPAPAPENAAPAPAEAPPAAPPAGAPPAAAAPPPPAGAPH